MVDLDQSHIAWRKSTKSTMPDNNCVEIGVVERVVLIRDSKNPGGPTLRISREVWGDFLCAIRRGDFDDVA
jgi:hypothetical protein